MKNWYRASWSYREQQNRDVKFTNLFFAFLVLLTQNTWHPLHVRFEFFRRGYTVVSFSVFFLYDRYGIIWSAVAIATRRRVRWRKRDLSLARVRSQRNTKSDRRRCCCIEWAEEHLSIARKVRNHAYEKREVAVPSRPPRPLLAKWQKRAILADNPWPTIRAGELPGNSPTLRPIPPTSC